MRNLSMQMDPVIQASKPGTVTKKKLDRVRLIEIFVPENGNVLGNQIEKRAKCQDFTKQLRKN